MLLAVLAGCGEMGNPGGGGGGGGGEPNDFSMACVPTDFYVPRGGSAPITVVISDVKGKVAKVRLQPVAGTAAGIKVNISPTEQIVVGNTSATFTVSVDSTNANNKPYFYIYGYGQDKDGRSNGLPLKSCSVQWSY